MYAVHLRLIGKLVVGFLLVIIELFSPGAFVSSQLILLTDRETDTNAAVHTMQHGKNASHPT